MIGLGLSVVQIAVRQLLGFDPKSLFAASEPGVWYDPSDFSTMFQDAAGTTPVTAVEQPVGLMLDKSRGLVLGSELVTNGDFSSGTTGWTAANATLSASSGVIRVTNTATISGSAHQQLSVVSGRWYQVSVRFVSESGANQDFRVGTTSTGVDIFRDNTTNSGVVTARFLAPASSVFVSLVAFNSSGTSGSFIEFSNISVRELPGNHATQTTATSRPVLKQDGNGKYYLRFDGVDDWLVTPTITPGTDKAQVFAGVRKLNDAAGSGTLVEMSVNSGTVNGAFLFAAPSGVANTYLYRNRGTVVTDALSPATYASPITNVITGLGDISGDSTILRVNGTQAASSTADQGTGNYLAYPLYVGRRGGTTQPFNGYIYGLIVRFGANLPAGTIASTESWVAGKTGITL